MEELGPRTVKSLLDDILTSKWRRTWSECGKGRVREYVESASARGNSVVEFGLEMGVLLTGHGSLNKFLFSRTFPSGHGFVLCGVDSEDWFSVSVQCTMTFAI